MLDKIIHERIRLGIMSALSAQGSLTFSEIKNILKVTDGNLSVHAAVLEKHGLISMKKSFHGKKPLTTFTITKKGRKKFKDYIRELERILTGEKLKITDPKD